MEPTYITFKNPDGGLGMKLPPGRLRIDSPTRGGDRKWNKLPSWKHG